MKPFMVPAEASHAYSLVADIRKEDNEEWVCASGSRTLPMLLRVLDLNRDLAQAVCDDQGCLLLFGATPKRFEPDTGLAWLLATNRAERRVVHIHQLFHTGLTHLHTRYPKLEAWAYNKNELHHSWMERVGFTRTGGVMQMGLGFDFLEFTHEVPHAEEDRRA